MTKKTHIKKYAGNWFLYQTRRSYEIDGPLFAFQYSAKWRTPIAIAQSKENIQDIQQRMSKLLCDCDNVYIDHEQLKWVCPDCGLTSFTDSTDFIPNGDYYINGNYQGV